MSLRHTNTHTHTPRTVAGHNGCLFLIHVLQNMWSDLLQDRSVCVIVTEERGKRTLQKEAVVSVYIFTAPENCLCGERLYRGGRRQQAVSCSPLPGWGSCMFICGLQCTYLPPFIAIRPTDQRRAKARRVEVKKT